MTKKTLNNVVNIFMMDGNVIVANSHEILTEFDKNADPAISQPILKWAGGKQWLASIARLLLPPDFSGTYFEPFMGGGSFFFAIAPQKAVIADMNAELISTYKTIREYPDEVISELSSYPYNKSFYYKKREGKNQNDIISAARIIYLNKTCWNGLYRVNRNGKFNVPFGKYTNPTICDEARIRHASKILKPATLLCSDFSESLNNVMPGDFVYLDPPYITGHKDNGFLMYNSRLFSWDDQRRLAKTAVNIKEKGGYVLISNANHNKVLELYKDFYHYRLFRKSLIGGNGSNRGMISEALLTSYPLFKT